METMVIEPRQSADLDEIDLLVDYYAKTLINADLTDLASDILQDYHAGEPTIALDGGVFYVIRNKLPVSVEKVEETVQYLDDDSYGMIECKKFLAGKGGSLRTRGDDPAATCPTKACMTFAPHARR